MKLQVDDQDGRIVKLENKTKGHDALHKQERTDIDELMGRMSKAENGSSIAGALADVDLGANGVDHILKAINDMQDKMNEAMDKKL